MPSTIANRLKFFPVLLLLAATTASCGGGGGGGAVYTSPPRIETGSLAITSNTSGQSVYIDGKSTGKSISSSKAITITDLFTGNHSVNLVLNGFKTTQQQVTIKANQTVTATFTMEIDITQLTGKLVFDSSDGNMYDIYTILSNGTGLTRLTNDQDGDGQPAWSHDGKKIAWCREIIGVDYCEIYIMGKEGSNKIRLTHNSKFDGQPSFTNDDKKILFASSRSTSSDYLSNIFIMNEDGGSIAQLTANNLVNSMPRMSPDGNKILYNTEVNGKYDGDAYQIFTMNTDGSNRKQLTNNGKTHSDARWSPDGRILYTEADHFGGRENLFIMNSDGSDAVQLGVAGTNYQYPVMSGDSRFIYYSDSSSYLHVMSYDGCCDYNYRVWAVYKDYNPGP